MMCKNCGNELVEGAKFCMECGTKVESAESNTVVSPVSMESSGATKNA